VRIKHRALSDGAEQLQRGEKWCKVKSGHGDTGSARPAPAAHQNRTARSTAPCPPATHTLPALTHFFHTVIYNKCFGQVISAANHGLHRFTRARDDHPCVAPAEPPQSAGALFLGVGLEEPVDLWLVDLRSQLGKLIERTKRSTPARSCAAGDGRAVRRRESGGAAGCGGLQCSIARPAERPHLRYTTQFPTCLRQPSSQDPAGPGSRLKSSAPERSHRQPIEMKITAKAAGRLVSWAGRALSASRASHSASPVEFMPRFTTSQCAGNRGRPYSRRPNHLPNLSAALRCAWRERCIPGLPSHPAVRK